MLSTCPSSFRTKVPVLFSVPRTPGNSLSSPPRLHQQSHRRGGGRSRRRRGEERGFCCPVAGIESVQSVAEAASVLTAIIVVHESGHFLAASLQGIRVSKFAVGFGPILAKFTGSNSVEYSLRAFPLGGFVGFPDDDPDSGISPDDPDLLRNRPIPDRLLVVSAGILANILFAYLLIFSQVISVGLPVQESLPGVRIPEVRRNSAAERDGLLPGDIILDAEGAPSPSVADIVDVVKNNPGRSLGITVKRSSGVGVAEDVVVRLNVVPDESPSGTGKIGVQLSPNYRFSKVRPRDLAEATAFSWKEFSGLTGTVLDGLKQTFLNFSQSAEKVSGPVAIIAVGAEVARVSSDGLFQFAAVLNLNLAVINLLPLPALDGGSMALLLVEAARGGRKIPREVEQGIMSSGIVVVLGVGLFLMVRDTLNLGFVRDLLL